MMGGRAGEVRGQNVDVGIGIYTLIIKGIYTLIIKIKKSSVTIHLDSGISDN